VGFAMSGGTSEYVPAPPVGAARVAGGGTGAVKSWAPVPVLPPHEHPAVGADQWPLRDSLELGALPRAASCARLHARLVVQEWGLAVLADDVELIVSELATNAIVHSRSRQPGGTFTVRAQLDRDRLRVEVCDQGGAWHTPARANADDQNGRGLLIVSQLASRWGCEGHSQTGWSVWFEIDIRTPWTGGR
jgi:serine/threonine-protein kinase RsbW